MRLATAMGNLDWLGQDGGKLAMAFAAGCIATFGFMSAIGGFIWKMIGGHRKDRITELEGALAEEKQHCSEQMRLLGARIQQLETAMMIHTGFQLAHTVDADTDITG